MAHAGSVDKRLYQLWHAQEQAQNDSVNKAFDHFRGNNLLSMK